MSATIMKPGRFLGGCVLVALCVLSAGARAQVVTEFSNGITPGAYLQAITAGPDGNLWFTEYIVTGTTVSGSAIGRITPLGVVTEFSVGIAADVGSGGSFLESTLGH